MTLLLFFCVLCAFLLPPPATMAVFLILAVCRIMYLTRDSAIDAAAAAITSPARLISDIRANGMDVLRVVLWWVAAICFLFAVLKTFHISF